MGITRKSFISLTVTISVMLFFFLAILYFTLPIYYKQSQKAELKKNYKFVVKQLRGESQTSIVSQLQSLDKKYSQLFFSLSDMDGNALYPNQEELTSYEVDIQELKETENNEIGFWTDSIRTAEGSLMILSGQYSYPTLTSISQTFLTFYPFVILLFIFITGIAIFIYSRLSTKRIKNLSLQTRQMQSLEKGLSFEVTGRDEISQLAQDINSLYNKLLISIENLEQENERTLIRERQKVDFLRMTSHELKTPITSMTGMVEGMLYNIGDFKNRDKYLNLCLQILTEQSQIVQSILEVSKLDLILKPNQDTFSLKELLEDILPTYEGIALVNHFQFDVQLEPLTITSHQLYLQKALKNLLDNAFCYTRPNGKIQLLLKEGQLKITNQAEQLLEDEQIEQVFQPFYRPDFSRNRQDGGTGLGLYIVDQILSKHRLNYHLNREEDSMVFTIDFTNLITD
ncbi:TPA: HAMP domain-containing histidine kinase [Streptococcus equi subsp. zooepidemicus]|nr:HAMP domain-containing histidine kinase [Streptococcus equi subsp. zooepidemicus]